MIGPKTEAEFYTLDMSRIASLVNGAGHPCIVEQTGGGTATIYAGAPNPNVQWEDEPNYYPVAAGPGNYWPTPEADSREFSVGSTEEPYDGFVDCEGFSEEQVAAEIVRLLSR